MVVISGPQIYTEEGPLKHAALSIENGKIHSIDAASKLTSSDTFIFPKNYHLVPGFIDVHVHGAQGADVMDASLSALETISKALAAEGTTSFLATTMTASIEKTDAVLTAVCDYRQKQKNVFGANILGVHLEGPFLSPKKAGAQCAEQVLQPDVSLIERWQKKSGGALKLITIAPELKEAVAFIHFLKIQNIAVSIGHTDATYDETLAAIEAGCSHVTHLFNAMRGIHQREPGVVTAALLSDKVSTELIVDGVHLHPAIIQLVLKIKNKEKIILVTDAMRAKCLPDGVYDLGGQSVEVKNNIASLSNGTLAGSTLKMFAALRNLLKISGVGLSDALRFVSENPAKLISVFDRKGSIAPGKDADLVVLDEALNVVLTMCEGKVVFSKEV